MRKTVYWIEGDGIGVDIWKAARPVLDAAVHAAYDDLHSIEWRELLAGEKAMQETGSALPDETIQTLRSADVAIKGPLGTPVGGGFRSLNVALRQILDLYACIRPVRYFDGLDTPVKHPERVNMVIFRENTEDVYAGIEYAAHSPEAQALLGFLREKFGVELEDGSALGIKPMCERKSKRLVRKAIQYALDRQLPSVTLVHKGNIMKYTEGAFRQWGYDLARDEFGAQTVTEDNAQPHDARLLINDRIADSMFQQVLIKPEQYSVIATPNLNGDYLSDALAAQVGGLGLAPGVNMSDSLAFFEATHGTAPGMAGQDKANPGSVILSGALMLEHLGWNDAATRIYSALEKVIANKKVTYDLARLIPNAQTVSCTAFGDLLIEQL